MTDADGRHTHTDYNEDRKVTKVTRPSGTTQAMTYDADDNVTVQTDGRGANTTYGFDALDRNTTITDSLGRASVKTYDLASNMTTLTQPGAGTATLTTSMRYDADNELVSIVYSDGATPAVAYSYDADGQRTSMVDGTGTTAYTWDSLQRLTQMTNGTGATVAYSYDIAGHALTIAYPGGTKKVTRGYDGAGRMTSVNDWLGNSTSFAYDNDGNLATARYPNNVTETRTYDNGDNVTAIVYATSSATLAKYTYTRNAGDQLASATPSSGAAGSASSYVYTADDELTSTAGSTSTAVWKYDAANRVVTLPTGATLAYDNADELTSQTTTGSATAYTYDARGDRTATAVGKATATSCGYDQAGRLTSVTTPAGVKTSYTYDGDGLRASKAPAAGATQAMTWDSATQSTPLLLSDTTSAYVYGPGGVPIEQVTGTTAVYLHPDQLGSTVLITTTTGAVSATYAYDPYGTVTAHTGAGGSSLLFGGQYTDVESGLVYLRARYYDPTTAQFLTRDPLFAQTRSAYGYVADDPLNGVDPSGLDWYDPSTWTERTWTNIGLTLGGIALVASGVGAAAGMGLITMELGTAVTVDFVGTLAGVGGTVIDYSACTNNGDKASCAGLVMGAIGSGFGVGGLAADIALGAAGASVSLEAIAGAGAVGATLFGGVALAIDGVGSSPRGAC